MNYLKEKCVRWFMMGIGIIYCCALLLINTKAAEVISVSDNAVSMDNNLEDGSTDLESEQVNNEELTLGIFYLVTGVSEGDIKKTTFYIDGIAYEVYGNEIILKINPSDPSVHSVYAVSDGCAQSGVKTFSFYGMQRSGVIALFDNSEDSSTISYVTGILKNIDFLPEGKLYMEDGVYYEYDHDKIVEERGLRGKTILCTLKNGVVIDFKEYIGTSSETTEIEENKYEKEYGVEKRPLTKQEKVVRASKEYNDAMNRYFNSLGQAAQDSLKKMNSTSLDKGRKLREIDQAKGKNRFLTTDAQMPSDAVDSAYAALSDFLDMYTDKGIELGKINLSDEEVEIEAQIVNKILSNIETNGFRRRKYGNYYVSIDAISIWGSYTGSLTVQGKGRIYTSVINSNVTDVANTMEQYLNAISDMTKDLEKQALQSIVDEFLKSSYIGEITKTDIKKLFVKKKAYLKKYRFGDPIVNICNDLIEDYDAGKSILELKDIDGFDDAMVNARSIYKKFEANDYKFEDIYNTGEGDSCAIVEKAVEKLDNARNNFISALCDYLYNTNQYKNNTDDNPFNSFTKICINCPVDFELNSSRGRIAYCNANGIASDYHNYVAVDMYGDRKVIIINDAYDTDIDNIKLTATDNGTMDYIIEKYENQKVIGRAVYYNVSLTEGETYSQNMAWDDVSTLTVENPLVSDRGESIVADEYLDVSDFGAVNVGAIADVGGKVIGAGIYAKGDTVTLTAIPDEGYELDGWYIGNEIQSADTSFGFTAQNDVSIEAKFIASNIESSDYKAVLSDDYGDFAGVFVYKNKINSKNIDILLKLDGSDYSAKFDAFTLRGYQNDKLLLDKVIQTNAKNQSSIIFENIDLNGCEHIDIYDAEDTFVGYLAYIPNYKTFEDFEIAENSSVQLQEDTYCDNLGMSKNSELDLNGYNLYVSGDVTVWYATINIARGNMKVGEDIKIINSGLINNGVLVVHGNFTTSDGDIKQQDEGTLFIEYGNVNMYGSTEDNSISAGKSIFGKDVYMDSAVKMYGTHMTEFLNCENQYISSTGFNDVLFQNNSIKTNRFGANKLLCDLNINGINEEPIVFDVKDFNGYEVTVNGNVSIYDYNNYKRTLNGGKFNVIGNLNLGRNLIIERGILKVTGDLLNDGLIELNDGKCFIAGNCAGNGAFDMHNKEDLIDINGNFDLEDSNKLGSYISGTIQLEGNMSAQICCAAEHKMVFDGSEDQCITGEAVFGRIEMINDNRIIIKSDTFSFVTLGSDMNILASNTSSFHEVTINTIEENYVYNSEENKYEEERKIWQALLNGYDLNVQTEDCDLNLNGYFDLQGGSFNIGGNIEEFAGYIFVDKGRVSIEGDWNFEHSLYGAAWISDNAGLLIMAYDDEIVDIHGKFHIPSEYQAIYEVDGIVYSANSKDSQAKVGISAGTINFYGDVDIDYLDTEGEKILEFTGSNKAVICGTKNQLIYMGGNSTFNQTEVRNANIKGYIGFGKLLSDIKAPIGIRDTDLNGHTVEILYDQEDNDADEEFEYIDGNYLNIGSGKLIYDKNVKHYGGKINIGENGKLIFKGDYNNWYSGSDYEYEEDGKKYYTTTYRGIINMLDDTAELYVDGKFVYEGNKGLDRGKIYLKGDVFIGENFFIVGSNVTLDGKEKQQITIGADWYEYKNGGWFERLIITQPLSNYNFQPASCWRILMDKDGNIIEENEKHLPNFEDDSDYDEDPDDEDTNDDWGNHGSDSIDISDINNGDKNSQTQSYLKKGTSINYSDSEYEITASSMEECTVSYIKNEDSKASTVVIPDTLVINGLSYKVTCIGKDAFKNNKKLKKVKIGKNVKIIENNAFYGCKNLNSISLDNQICKIGSKAFYKCTALKKVIIPSKVEKIGKQAFYGCKNLKNITIKTKKLTKKNIGSKAFKGINTKAKIKVPKGKRKTYKMVLRSKGIGLKVSVK